MSAYTMPEESPDSFTLRGRVYHRIREDILKEWAKEGILSVETADSCLLERYWFNIYRLELGGMTGTAERTISRVKD